MYGSMPTTLTTCRRPCTRWSWRFPRYGFVPEQERLPAAEKRQRARQGLRRQRGIERHREPGAGRIAPRREVVDLALAVHEAEGRSGGDRHGAPALGEQHPHRRRARLDELRPRVVVGEDLLVRHAALRLAVRAPLPHADAVAPAASADHVRRRGDRVVGRLGLSGHGCACREQRQAENGGSQGSKHLGGRLEETHQASGTVLAPAAGLIPR